MTSKDELLSLRGSIDGVDVDITRLFQERQRISTEIARVKAEGNIAITDENREQEVIKNAMAQARDENKISTMSLMRTLISLSKIRQNEQLGLMPALEFPEPGVWSDGKAAFQGLPGAWSEHCAQLMFPDAEKIACTYFEDVFEAVKSGAAAYGVLPIENSHTGAIGEVYDLLRRYSCYIVDQMWVSVSQCLIGVPGAVLTDVREVLSHPEGFSQTQRFLKNRSWELTACRNTAVAAKMVAERADKRFAAIGSRRAAAVNGLEILAPDIADDVKNRTRFIVIAAEPIYDESADTVTITFSTQHHSGALCAVLQTFMLAGINLTRIESRPVSADKYRFFADLQTNILSQETRDAINEASMQCDYFEVLGCYRTSQEPKSNA